MSSEIDWNQTVSALGPGLYRYFCARFEPALAADLVQETLIRLVKKHRDGEFLPEKGSLKSFAFGIARFVRLENVKMGIDFEFTDNGNSLDICAAPDDLEKDDVAHLRWAIRQLKPIEQEIICCLIETDAELEHIATEMNMPLGTVKSHVHRAKERLRQIMGGRK